MDHDKYIEQLAAHLAPEGRWRLLDHDAAVELPPDAPLGNFFNDDLFTLLYRSENTYPASLAQVREDLLTVSGTRPRHVRATAALALGRFLQVRCEPSEFQVGSSSPVRWFQLARELNSVVGAAEVANALLAQEGKRVTLDLSIDPLPKLVQIKGTDDDDGQRHVKHRVAQAWYLGARVGLRHVQRGFSGWDAESFTCALSCVVNYLTLLPPRHGFESPRPRAERREALKWLKPFWNKLIVAASRQHVDPQAYRDALVEQQLAVLVFLEQDEPYSEQSGAWRSRAKAPTRTPRKPRVNEIIIVPGEIPPATERSDMEYLKRFEVLREPMAFKEFPSVDKLQALHATLLAEFPWAQDAVSLVMSDLFARKRHGALRLGMAPVVLVGPPGTGKTRFVQRLGELLNTPNAVINLAGMTDVKVLKGVTRGWSSNRTSRMVEFILQTQVPNPLFILDEIDKTQCAYSNGGDPQDALLDLLEPGNARRYHDVFLLTECDLSHCMYIATSNSLQALSEPLLSRLRPVLFPAPGPEHAQVILKGVVRDLELAWGLPAGTVIVSDHHAQLLQGLSAREMRRALLELLGRETDAQLYAQH
ncbi:AAA family ATPase [Eoetvoesiella caeni]|uniref:ATPase family protein associated with various cellular activities (AAA) n=1 Tax=Eoetvoesiella caeni TaxID=645616 RepID=A0A366H3S6_9BURK|nr:AAA family ATPase [Eoetvoesiella caeni]MCI2810998.1 AAA family ATPase [Eoetvoesiella caeni]NYT56896.1 AAA family ATPase [Eoetvoesiella caeni]RBP35464.1 ATPase family protein associated with various cellular activities (AAA) [Eoetvoesiella caeni]